MELSKILIVEDELIVAKSIAKNLTKLNYEAIGIVTSGEEAIDFVDRDPPDLILMDIFLQGNIDGIEAANQIWKLHKIPVIYLTANADIKTVERATKTGSFGYILKPFKPQELQATIEIAISKYCEQKNEQEHLKLSESLRKEAETLSQLKSQYMAIASHEFKTPLTSILGSSSLLENYSNKLSESQKSKHLQRIQKAVKQMNQLLEDVLILGHLDSGKISCNPTKIELVDFCRQLIEDFQSIHPNKSIIFTHNMPLMTAYIDSVILRHILSNLLSNALKYSHKQIDFELSGEERLAIFQIRDRGIGIPPDEVEHLFETFHRAKNVGKIPGTGLGLSIVKNFVEIHHGNIEVNSVLDSGTTVTVTLPIKKEESMIKILTIEDEDNIREMIVETLMIEGFEVMSAENGRLGLQIAQENLPDLIICDVIMPELDGYGVINQLNENPETRGIPFIFLTGKDSIHDFRYGMNLGANDYLTKPFTSEDLVTAVKARLKRSRLG